MDLDWFVPLPMGLISAAARDLVFRAMKIVAAAKRCCPGWPDATVFTAVLGAWMVNSADWGLGGDGLLIAVCLGSLVATAAIAVGWVSEPEKLERWAIRAGAAAFVSALPILIG